MHPDRDTDNDPADAPENELPIELGQRIGSYRLVSRLGDGGMGVVFKGVHEQLSRFAAIKVLRRGASHDPDMVARFFTEAESVNIVHHPGIVNIFEFGQLPDQTVYIVMEYLEGESLLQRLQQAGRLGLSGLRLMRQLASALGAAHAHEVIHRDLKPENVMIVADPDVPGGERTKLLDFGIAKMAQGLGRARLTPLRRPRLTRAGMVFGTPTYMSPEQCRDSANVTDRSDVYALGVMLYEVLAGAVPFASADIRALMQQHIHELPPDIRERAPDTPPELVALLTAMLRKDPTTRPSMEEVAEALGRLIRAGEAPPPRRWPRWVKAALIAGPVLLLIGGGVATGYVVHRRTLQARLQERDLGYLRTASASLLQERLRDGDPAVRRAALGLLAASGDGRLRTLIEKLLGDADVAVQVRAAEALGQLRDGAAVVTLLSQAVAARSPALRVAIAAALRDLGSKEGERLLREAAVDPGARRAALLLLAERGDAAARAALGEEKLSDDELLQLLTQLARRGDPGALVELRRSLRTPPDLFSLRIAAALLVSGDAGAADQGRGVLRQVAGQAGALQVRAAWLLAQAGDSDAARGFFQGALGQRGRPLGERVLVVEGLAACGPAAEATRLGPLLLHPEAGRAGDELRLVAAGGVLRLVASDPDLVAQDSLEWARRMLDDRDPAMRGDAVTALGMSASRLTLPLLQKAMHDMDDHVREQAAWALGRTRSEAAMPLLAEAMADRTPAVRQQATLAQASMMLGMGDARGASTLRSLLQDPDPTVRFHAAAELARQGMRDGVTVLADARYKDSSTGLMAYGLLRALGEEVAAPPAQRLLDAAVDPDAAVRRQAAETAAMMPGGAAVLRELLRDPDRLVRTQAAAALRSEVVTVVHRPAAAPPAPAKPAPALEETRTQAEAAPREVKRPHRSKKRITHQAIKLPPE